jgi:hypothetical protein
LAELTKDDYVIRLYEPTEIMDAWAPLAAFISAACRRGPCEFTALELRDQCIRGERNLWSVREIGKGMVGAAVTTITQEPGRRVMIWTAVGGKRWDTWSHFEDVIAATAKSNGASAIRGYCRRGWKKKLKSYKEIGVIMEREI